MTKASCSECPSTYELIPPPDPDYSEPKENPRSNDHIKRIYECGEGGQKYYLLAQKRGLISKQSE
jgi:hypothetical protein